jgi:hypothetical protein
MMKFIGLIFLMASLFIFTSCEKWGDDITIIEGVIRDHQNGQPVAGSYISVDAIKSPASFAISFSGYRKVIGTARSDQNGVYKIKCKIPKDAQSIDIKANEDLSKTDYSRVLMSKDIADINMSGNNRFDLKVGAVSLLKVKFKNTSPVSSSDYLNISWFGAFSLLQTENCGTVLPDEALFWKGMDVCGSYTLSVPADTNTTIKWSVKKNDIWTIKETNVFAKRGMVTEFVIAY